MVSADEITVLKTVTKKQWICFCIPPRFMITIYNKHLNCMMSNQAHKEIETLMIRFYSKTSVNFELIKTSMGAFGDSSKQSHIGNSEYEEAIIFFK